MGRMIGGALAAAALVAMGEGPAAAQDAPLATPLATPSGEARIEGRRIEGGARLLLGDRVAYAHGPVDLWIEAQAGDLLLIGESAGGNVCPALYVWVRTADGAATEPFGTCSDLATVTHDSETVTVTMPSLDPAEGRVAFTWDGRSPVREAPAP